MLYRIQKFVYTAHLTWFNNVMVIKAIRISHKSSIGTNKATGLTLASYSQLEWIQFSYVNKTQFKDSFFSGDVGKYMITIFIPIIILYL